MSRRRELEQHRHRISEIREILGAMKSLAFMETRKLADLLDARRSALAHLSAVAEDFFSFHSATLPAPGKTTPVYLLLGSERGFCGDFNESLALAMEAELRKTAASPWLVATGTKLNTHLPADSPQIIRLGGAAMVEDTERTLVDIIDTLSGLQKQHGDIALTIFHRDPERQEVRYSPVLPPFQSLHPPPSRFAHPPLLNLSPEKFCVELIDRYLLNTLYEAAYLSLMAENQRRVTHLGGAEHQLDDKLDALQRRANTLRQEEITEEIEVILLNSVNTDGRSTNRRGRGRDPR